MKLLWLTPKWPLPADDGQKIASLNLLRQVAHVHEVDVLAFTQSESPDTQQLVNELGVRHAMAVRLPERGWHEITAMFGQLPVTVSRFHAAAKRTDSEWWLEKYGPWDAVLLDTLHPAAFFFREGKLRFPAKKLFYRAHNVESELWEQSAERKPLFRSLLLGQAERMRNFERIVLAASAAVYPVSLDDLNKLRALESAPDYEWIPIGMEFLAQEPRKPDYFLFLGRLDWPPNRDGLRWFLDEVWLELLKRRPTAKLVVAGSGRSSWLDSYRGLPGMQLIGRVDEVAPLYKNAAALLVPIFYGSGTRVKAIEAARFAVPVVSTELGVQGLGLSAGETFVRAESAAEWIESLAAFKDNGIGAKAHAQLRESFEERRVAERFLKAISKHILA